jgi:PadR family transcriptional regulator PadR
MRHEGLAPSLSLWHTTLRLLWGKAKIPMKDKKPSTGELLRDTLDMLVLKTLTRGAMHGYAIAEFIEETTDDVLRVEEGALYPALHRLELRGLVAAVWGISENNRRARYYKLTAAGRKQLGEESARWDRMTAAVARIMEA